MKKIRDYLNLSSIEGHFFSADWLNDKVGTLISTRQGGVSQGIFASLNVGFHVGDDAQAVAENRRRVQAHIPVPLAYVNQIHGNGVALAQQALEKTIDADALIDFSGKVACGIMTADCLPILLADTQGSVVAAIHGGWRSLAADIIQNTIEKMAVPPHTIMAYLGPAISADAFEVGEDVREAFLSGCLKDCQQASQAFIPLEQKYLADIYQLAKLLLQKAGVAHSYGGDFCTVIDREHFFSYRRDGQTGRMVSAIWLQQQTGTI